MGYLSMAMDLNNLARLFLANALISSAPTAPSEIPPPIDPFTGDREEEQPLTMAGDARSVPSLSYSKLPLAEREPFGDESRLRAMFKRVGITMLLLRFTALIPAITSGALYFNGTKSSSTAAVVQATRSGLGFIARCFECSCWCRYGSAFFVLIAQLLAISLIFCALRRYPHRTPRKPALYLLAMISVNVSSPATHQTASSLIVYPVRSSPQSTG